MLRAVLASNLYHYRWFLVQLLCIASAVLCTGLHLLARLAKRTSPTPCTVLPLKAMAALAVLDGLHSMLIVIPTGVVPLPMAIALPHLVVPVLTVGKCLIKRSCRDLRPIEAVGAAMLCGGVLAVVVTGVADVPATPCPPHSTRCGRSRAEIGANAVMLACAAVPAAASHLSKAHLLNTTPVDASLLVNGHCP